MKSFRRFMRWVLAAGFLVAGANHFRFPPVYLGMMPPWVPWPAHVNIFVGAAEAVGALGLMFAAIRQPAGWGLIALLIAVFPANVHVALLGKMPGYHFTPLTLWLRLPCQLVLIAWVWWVAFEPSWKEPPARWS